MPTAGWIALSALVEAAFHVMRTPRPHWRASVRPLPTGRPVRSCWRFRSAELERAGTHARRRRAAGRHAGRSWPAPSGSNAGAARATRRCTRATGRSSRSSAASGGACPSWPRSTIAFQPYLEARDAIKSQLEDLALFLRQYANGIEASPARLQQVEERLALARASEAEVRADAGRRPRPTRSRPEGARRARAKRRADGASSRGEHADRASGVSRRRAANSPPPGRVSATPASHATSSALLGELAMERTVFEVRFNAEPLPEGRVDDERNRRGRVLRVCRTWEKTFGRSRESSPAASCRVSCSQ